MTEKYPKSSAILLPEFDWLRQINEQNMDELFDLNKILANSIYYPASGIDATDIKHGSWLSQSFVHADYSKSSHEVYKAMQNDFHKVGFDVVGIKTVTKQEFTPKLWRNRFFALSTAEKERLHFYHEAIHKLDEFVFWALYRLREECPHKEGKAKMFSLLHIGGEACAAYHALYTIRCITPRMISLIRPGVGYGDNWTNFFDTEHVFYKLVSSGGIPEYIMQLHEYIWPEYNKNTVYHTTEFNTENNHLETIKIFQKFCISSFLRNMIT